MLQQSLKIPWTTTKTWLNKYINKNKQIFKSFCTAKQTRNKTTRQPTELEKIFSNDATHKTFPQSTNSSCCWIKKKKKNGWKILINIFPKMYRWSKRTKKMLNFDNYQNANQNYNANKNYLNNFYFQNLHYINFKNFIFL